MFAFNMKNEWNLLGTYTIRDKSCGYFFETKQIDYKYLLNPPMLILL